MGASVFQRVYVAVAVAHDDERRLTDKIALEVAGLRDFRLQADELPCWAVEDACLFGGIDGGIGIDPVRNAGQPFGGPGQGRRGTGWLRVVHGSEPRLGMDKGTFPHRLAGEIRATQYHRQAHLLLAVPLGNPGVSPVEPVPRYIWTAADLAADRGWQIPLPPPVLAEVEALLPALRGKKLEELTAADCPLPSFAGIAARVVKE